MNTALPDPSSTLLANLPSLLPKLEALYKDVHAHPELSMQENRTADLAAKHLRDNGYEVTAGVGTFDEGVRKHVLAAIGRIVNAEAQASGAPRVPEITPAGRINDLPVNHSPLFAPVIHPTLQTGIEAMVAGALAWLAK